MKATPPAAPPAGVAVYIGRKGAGLYKVGDKVVYPHHGAGTVIKKEKREVLGEKREYLTIKILHNDMTVNVPSENAEKVGLRKVIGEDMVKVVVKALTGGGTQMPKNWNRRFKHNRDKMKTGDILELAEVVRNLSLRDREKGLSTGEKQMFVKAKKILASELMYAKEMDEEATAEWLDGVLAGANETNGTTPKKTTASSGAKKSPAAAAAPGKASSKKPSTAKATAKKPAAKKATAAAR
jgi:CarD family transcriptional regulator